MAERTFDYNAVSSVYNEIKRITTGSDSIKTILDKINNDYHNMVDVDSEAVYGELGRQLLLDWDNTSSNFPNFVNNFENWSALIAQASGNYSEFENAIAGFKQDHMLGATSEAGRTTAYTNDGFYSNSYSIDELDDMASLAKFYELTGATYVDTGMVSYAEKSKRYRMVSSILDYVSLGASVSVIVKAFKGAGIIAKTTDIAGKAASTADAAALAKASNSVSGGYAFANLGNRVSGMGNVASTVTHAYQNASLTATWYSKFAGTFAKTLATDSAFWNSVSKGAQASRGLAAVGATTAAAGFFSDVSYYLGMEYDYSRYATGTQGDIPLGLAVNDGNQEFVYFGITNNGTRLVSNTAGDIYYLNDNQEFVPATIDDANGNRVNANMSNLGSNFTMYIGNEIVDENTNIDPYENTEKKDYFEEIAHGIENTSSLVEEN